MTGELLDDHQIYKYIAIYCILLLVHTMTLYVAPLGILLGILELMYLTKCAINESLDKFLISLCIILPTCYEIPLFVYGETERVIYSCMNLPIFQGYLLELLLFIPLLRKGPTFFLKCYSIIIDNPILRKIYVFLVTFIIVGFGGAILCLLLNDNNVYNMHIIKHIYHDFYFIATPILIFVYFIYSIIKYESLSRKIEMLIVSFMFSINIFSIISLMCGLRGAYGINGIVLAPLSLFFSTFILLFLLIKTSGKAKALLIITAIISLFVQFKFSNALGGKSWLVLLVIFIYLSINLYAKYKTFSICSTFLVVSLLGVKIANGYETLKEQNSKFDQVSSLFDMISLDAYDLVPFSPKVRIEEFLNILEEIKRKPYAVLGKGFGGSVRDYRFGFGIYEEGAFSNEEYDNNAFIFMHETINVFFLKFGVIGLIFLFYIIKQLLKYHKSNPMLFIGTIWLLLFFNYSLSMAIIGIPCLLLGIYHINLFSNHDSFNIIKNEE